MHPSTLFVLLRVSMIALWAALLVGCAGQATTETGFTAGRRIVAVATYDNGKPWNPIGFYREFGHARLAFTKAAEPLRDELRPQSIS